MSRSSLQSEISYEKRHPCRQTGKSRAYREMRKDYHRFDRRNGLREALRELEDEDEPQRWGHRDGVYRPLTRWEIEWEEGR